MKLVSIIACNRKAYRRYITGKIGSDLIQVDNPMRTEGNTIVEDVQNGQDIVVRIKNGEEWLISFT